MVNRAAISWGSRMLARPRYLATAGGWIEVPFETIRLPHKDRVLLSDPSDQNRVMGTRRLTILAR